jgi:hypothetical protein
MVDNARQVALAAAIRNLIDADRDQPGEALLVETVSDDALHDPPDRVPTDPQQPGDRRLGHLLRQPGDHVPEVTGVARAGPRPRDRFELSAAVRTPHAAKLALDHATRRTEVEVTPALDAMPVHMHAPAGLPTTRAHPATAAQADGHDHPLAAEADVRDRRARQAQQSGLLAIRW